MELPPREGAVVDAAKQAPATAPVTQQVDG